MAVQNREKVIIFGAGGSGKKLFNEYQKQDEFEIIAFADNFKTGTLFGLPILRPEELVTSECDAIVIAATAAGPIKKQLLEIGVPKGKMRDSDVVVASCARRIFLKRMAQEIERMKLGGQCAEAGFFQGDFACQINQCFPDRKLYLFDTFTGFDERDLAVEKGYDQDPARGEYFKQTSVELVLSKMRYPGNVIVKQGHFRI